MMMCSEQTRAWIVMQMKRYRMTQSDWRWLPSTVQQINKILDITSEQLTRPCFPTRHLPSHRFQYPTANKILCANWHLNFSSSSPPTHESPRSLAKSMIGTNWFIGLLYNEGFRLVSSECRMYWLWQCFFKIGVSDKLRWKFEIFPVDICTILDNVTP